MVYDCISGWRTKNPDGTEGDLQDGRLALFRNFDEHGNPLAKPNTLLIDSEQLEAGDALDDNFRTMAADEIERFRRAIIERTQDSHAAEKELSQIIYEQTGGNQDFALIRSKGDQALFSKSTQAMKAHWKVPDHRPLADFAPTIILKAKDFATEITIFNAREHQLGTEAAISTEHITNNQAVRKTLLERGIRPESLPPAEDVKKVERRLASADKKSLNQPEPLDP